MKLGRNGPIFRRSIRCHLWGYFSKYDSIYSFSFHVIFLSFSSSIFSVKIFYDFALANVRNDMNIVAIKDMAKRTAGQIFDFLEEKERKKKKNTTTAKIMESTEKEQIEEIDMEEEDDEYEEDNDEKEEEEEEEEELEEEGVKRIESADLQQEASNEEEIEMSD